MGIVFLRNWKISSVWGLYLTPSSYLPRFSNDVKKKKINPYKCALKITCVLCKFKVFLYLPLGSFRQFNSLLFSLAPKVAILKGQEGGPRATPANSPTCRESEGKVPWLESVLSLSSAGQQRGWCHSLPGLLLVLYITWPEIILSIISQKKVSDNKRPHTHTKSYLQSKPSPTKPFLWFIGCLLWYTVI